MKIFFLGLNELGDTCLAKLLENNSDVAAVVVPDKAQRTAGMPTLCREHDIDYSVFTDMDSLRQQVEKVKPDLMVIASFNRIIPEAIFSYPKLGAINVHPSLLPKYRGPYPINWAIIKDEKEIGVSIHYLAAAADEGDILEQATIPLTNADTFITMRKKLHDLGASLLVKVIAQLATTGQRLPGIRQDNSQATLAPRRRPPDSQVDWSKNSREIFNLVRGVTAPYSVFTHDEEGRMISFLQAYVVPEKSGTVLAELDGYYLITTGDGVIMLKSDTKLSVGQKLF